MKKYEIAKRETEVKWEARGSIEPWCTFNNFTDLNAETVASYNTIEEARKDFESRKSSVVGYNGGLFKVTEYTLEVHEYDEDGDLAEAWAEDPEAVSPMVFTLEEISGETVGTFESYEDLEKAMNDYNGDKTLVWTC